MSKRRSKPNELPARVEDGEIYIERDAGRIPYGVVHNHVMYDNRLSFAARTLYGILCGHASTGDRSAYPSTERLNELMGCSDRTRWGAQDELTRFGYLRVERRTDRGLKRGNTYVLTDTLPAPDFPHQRTPTPEVDDGSQRPAVDYGSSAARPEVDDGSQRPAVDDGAADLKGQRSAVNYGSDPQLTADRYVPQSTAVPKHPLMNKARSGVSHRKLTPEEHAIQRAKTAEAERQFAEPHCPHGYPIRDADYTRTASHACALCRTGQHR